MSSSLKVFFIAIMVGIIILKVIVFKSYSKQMILLEDYNTAKELIWPLDDLKDFSYELPNISATTLPIKGMIAGYYERENDFKKAISLLKSSIKYNPYIKFNEFRLAGIYETIGMKDSAFYYYKDAYEGLPNHLLHGAGYLQHLILRDSLQLARKHFLEISTKYKSDYVWTQYLVYLQDKIQLDGNVRLSEEFDSLVFIAKERFPQKKYFDEMDVISKFGLKKVINTNKLNDSAENYFNESEFQKALRLYEESIEIIDDINIYENIILTNLKLNRIKESRKIFHNLDLLRLESEFKNHKKGMLEYYVAVSFIEENKDSSCFYFNKSQNKGNLKSKQFFEQICNN